MLQVIDLMHVKVAHIITHLPAQASDPDNRKYLRDDTGAHNNSMIHQVVPRVVEQLWMARAII
jgi:hypothetical protein